MSARSPQAETTPGQPNRARTSGTPHLKGLRVAVVTGIYPPDIGGPATHAHDLATELRTRGHDVVVLALTDERRTAREPGLVRWPRRWQWPTRLGAVAWWIVRHRGRIDAVYATGLETAAVAGARLARRPVVVKVVADAAWERARRLGLTRVTFEEFQRLPASGRVRLMRAVRDRTLRAATAVVAPSAHLADAVRIWTGAHAAVVPNGVRIPAVAASPAPGEALRVVTVGRLAPVKRIDLLLRAIEVTPGAELEVVGDGPSRDDLERLAASLAIAGRVRFAGALPRDEVLRVMQAADVLALTSDHEGLPHVALESIACGTPVLAVGVGGVREIVRDGVNGLLVTEDGIGAALASLRDDHALRTRLRDGARESAGDFAFERCADRIEDLLRSVARPRAAFFGSGGWRDAAARRAVLERYVRPVVVRGARGPGAVAAVALAGPRGGVVCQSPYEGFAAIVVARCLPRALRPRIVVEVHGDWRTATRGYGRSVRRLVAPLADRAATWAIRRADVVRAVSAHTTDLARDAGYGGEIECFPARLDLGPFLDRPPAVPPGAPRVAYVGALERVKGIDVLLDAWALVRSRIPDATLAVAGAGSLAVCGDGVEALGPLDAEGVRALLDDARFVVVPSRSEGFGRVVLEAFARGRAVVASRVGGIPELVEDGRTGLLVGPEDRIALADAIVALLGDPDRAATMGVEARKAAEARDPAAEFEAGMARLAARLGRA